MRLAVSEAVSNVIVHGYRETGSGAFTVAIEHADGAGLGLPLIANLADTLSVTAPPGGGTEVSMTFPLRMLTAA